MNPAEVSGMARLVVKKLMLSRQEGIITPQKPVTGPELVRAYNLKFGTDVREKDFWEIVQFIRVDLGLPLGSNDRGYFWCANEDEWNETKAYLRGRIDKQLKAIERPTIYFATKKQLDLAGFDVEPAI